MPTRAATVPDAAGPVAEVRAAGGVLWRREGDRVEVALVHRPRYGDWSLPKGKLEPREPAVVGAVREVAEETGHLAVPGRTLGSSRYRVLHRGRDVEKSVQWWSMRACGGDFVPNDEVDALRWLPVSTALSRVSAGYDCAPLRAFEQAPPETTTVLLLAGPAPAEAVAELLTAYRPERVLSGSAVRSRATVQALADRLGTSLEVVEAADDGSAPGGLADLVRELAASERTAVVCSSPAPVTGALQALLGRPDAGATAGSLWALSLDGTRLVDAHCTPIATP